MHSPYWQAAKQRWNEMARVNVGVGARVRHRMWINHKRAYNNDIKFYIIFHKQKVSNITNIFIYLYSAHTNTQTAGAV